TTHNHTHTTTRMHAHNTLSTTRHLLTLNTGRITPSDHVPVTNTSPVSQLHTHTHTLTRTLIHTCTHTHTHAHTHTLPLVPQAAHILLILCLRTCICEKSTAFSVYCKFLYVSLSLCLFFSLSLSL